MYFNSSFKQATRGAGLIEYGLLAGLIAAVAIYSVSSLGLKIDSTFTKVNAEVDLAHRIMTAERVIDTPMGPFPAQSCLVADTGAQTFIETDPEAEGYDCYDLGGGGDILDIAASTPRAIAYYIHDGSNTAFLPSGNHVILLAGLANGGTEILNSEGGASQVSLANTRSADAQVSIEAGHLRIGIGSKLIDMEHQFDDGEPFAKFAFKDGVFTSNDLRTRALADASNDSNNTITGSNLADVITPGAGFDTVVPFDGDDRIIYSSGSMLIPGGAMQGAGFDTLDMSNFASTDVTLSLSYGTLNITINATGDTISVYAQDSFPDLNINEIVFSDRTLDEAALRAL